MHEGELSEIPYKGGEKEKRREGKQSFLKRGWQTGSRGGCLKQKEAGTLLETLTPSRLSYPSLDYHLLGETLNMHKSSARIKSQPDSQSAYSENS